MKSFGFLILLAVVVWGAMYGIRRFLPHTPHSAPSQTGENQASPEVGGTLPDFELTALDGSQKRISEFGKKVLLINFWATWCEACIVEMPSIRALRNRYKDQGFEAIALNVDDDSDPVKGAMERFQIDFPVYREPEQKVADFFDVTAIPFTILIDQNRKILLIEQGEHNWDSSSIHEKVENWLKK